MSKIISATRLELLSRESKGDGSECRDRILAVFDEIRKQERRRIAEKLEKRDFCVFTSTNDCIGDCVGHIEQWLELNE